MIVARFGLFAFGGYSTTVSSINEDTEIARMISNANSGISVINNTFVPFDGATGDRAYAIWFNSLPGYEPDFTFANNLCFGTNANPIREVQPEVNIGNLVAGSSPFVDLAAGDVHLLSGTAPIDSADPDYAPADDNDGRPRPVDGDGDGTSAPDIGAHEYVP